MHKRRRQRLSDRKGTFDPADAEHVKHTRVGVWDLYEEVGPVAAKLPGASSYERWVQVKNDLPYVWRMLKDLGSIGDCWLLLAGYLAVEWTASLLPAVALWYTGQLLEVVQFAMDHRAVDLGLLLKVAAAKLACSIFQRILDHAKQRLSIPLNARIKRHYSVHVFNAMARLDVPTFDDDAVQRQLEHSLPANSRSSIAWDMVVRTSKLISISLQLVSQVSVLTHVLRGQHDGPLLAALSFGHTIFRWATKRRPFMDLGVWAATTSDPDYIKLEGLKRVVGDGAHRKEIVAGGIWQFLLAEYQQRAYILGDKAGSFFEAVTASRSQESLTVVALVQEILPELPYIVFTLRAVQYPASIPASIASLNLITQTTGSFTRALFSLFDESGSLADDVASVRRLYDVVTIKNRVRDGAQPYPQNQQSLAQGITVEFRNVSFRYPGTDSWALKDVSFRLLPGQLCVIVGVNGSGKSTILKLIARLYDPTEGQILIDDQDISILRLEDLRRAMAVLFQDFTHFPLSIGDNIGLGDPQHAADEDKIREAARLGGAEEFVDRLPDGFDTYVERPVKDFYSALPEGTSTLFGRPVDHGRLRRMGGMSSRSTGLSGGQMQRIALSRTFMRSIVSESGVGLLLFDEPSASLDPSAEHDLFERLRDLKGNKTMIFSSHRFGNLTRHANLILYMDNSRIIEEGTHEQLLKHAGEYARIWGLQAQAFLP
ncbi:P-loop containing nucleoside triphosphate hydrolase protein [Pluteus cervinus]|uniref:P-loop containing nucleoside triphosphate hydrolase protein n=1 Tax=Pluteus cervinus TaxID=181527 RepID=A0ACD3BHV5_9AGAR|nr:P-loop containing nucleoside triphosphate hydrolase protein [Pluteus cervinus]